MNDALLFLLPAMAICVVIASLHVYLGMHILEREVIFVDLALAQLASLGAILGASEDAHAEDAFLQLGAFAFTVAGAALFALAGRFRHLVSQEAIVGIVYAVASAAMILVLSRAPHGAEQIKSVLVGALLITTWEDVLHMGLAYLPIGLFHLVFASRFLPLSFRDENRPPNRADAWWDFLFYALFGVVITLSVEAAGVLLVFSFLIVPAVLSKLFAKGLLTRLWIGWVLAIATSFGGLAGSWAWDLPAGATIVVAFGTLLAVTAPGAVLLRWRDGSRSSAP